MAREEIKIDFPVKYGELLNYTFNYDNLIKALSFLHNNDVTLSSRLKDFDKRISNLESLKNDIEEIKIQARNIQNTNENLNRSVQNLQERLLKNDYKINELNQKASDNKSTLEEHNKLFLLHGENLDHLNRVVEDNIKKTNFIGEEVEEKKKEIGIIQENINDLKKKDKDLEDLIQMKNQLLNVRIDENKKDIVKINNYLEDLSGGFKKLKQEIEIKNKEFENSITNIIKNIASGNANKTTTKKADEKKEEDENTGLLIKTVNDNILLSSKIAQLEVDQKNFKEFISKYNKDKDNYNNNIEINSKDISDLQNEIDNLKKEIESSSNDRDDGKKIRHENIDLSKYVTHDMFRKLSDNIRILTSSLGTTPSRDEFETAVRKINIRLETVEFIQQGVTSGPRTMINSDLVQKEGETKTYIAQTQKIFLPLKEEGKSENIEDIKKLIITTINEEMKNISLLQNPKFAEIFQLISKCEEQIGKNDGSIINIRNIIALSPTQNDIMIIKQDIERLSEESKKKFNEILRILNGDDDEEEDEEENKNGLAGFCMKKKIDILISKYHELFNKMSQVQNRTNSLTKEVKEEVKQHLKTETLKVVEDFKLKLENFTAKFEIELRNKIDRGGLSVFEDKLNSKFKVDLKEKLDRVELKKNNNVIKRKIDSLENKISKTLVDTIIDLQMDEAPLIIKKNAKNYELCASCNQPVKKNDYLNTDRNFYKSSNLSSIKGKNSFRNNSNHHINANMNMNQTNTNFNSKKLPGITSYAQSK